MNIADANLRTIANGFLLDMPEENDPNGVIDAIRGVNGRVISVVPRRKRLEDLFVETVRVKGASS